MAVRRGAAVSEEKRIRETYIHGNVVPKPVYEPERQPKRVPKTEPGKQQREEQVPLFGFRRGIDFLALSMLVAALGVMIFFMVGYLGVAAKNTELDKQIRELSTGYNTLCRSNDNKLANIADEVDLKDVYQVAVGKLGMVYPKDNQIITYDYQGEGYVRQYAAIPQAERDKKTVLEEVLDQFFRK